MFRSELCGRLHILDVQRVVWVSPTDDVADRVRRILTGFTQVRVAGQWVTIPPDRFARLYFCAYDQWPNV